MPIKYLPVKKAYKYGSTGKAYTISKYGKEAAYQKARKQGQAIEISKMRNSITTKASTRAKGYQKQL